MPLSKPWHCKLQQAVANVGLVVTTFGTLQIEFRAILAEQWVHQTETNEKL